MNQRINYVVLLLLLSSVILTYPSSANAECDPDNGGHRACTYYASSQETAIAKCEAEVAVLAAEGYEVTNGQCGFGYVRTDRGIARHYTKSWMTKDTEGNRKQPFQFVTVLYPNYCDGVLNVDTGACEAGDKPKENDGCGSKNAPKSESSVGNPCNVATGNKFQVERDFNIGNLSFTRTYNSNNTAQLGLGSGWRHSHQKKLIVSGAELIQVSGSGRGEPWIKEGGAWYGEVDTTVLIEEVATGFTLTTGNGAIEQYDASGKILSVLQTNGHQVTYAYNANGELDQVTNQYGQSIIFSYAGDMLQSVTDSNGVSYFYEYDSRQNLSAVVYPDQTVGDNSDNPRRSYLYENHNYRSHLTGIIDENGDRYATYYYDGNGKAKSTEHATTTNGVGQERFELRF